MRAIHADFIVASGATRATSDRPVVWPLGELMNFVVYPLDTIRGITGLEVTRVGATRGGYFFDGPEDEDIGVLSLTLDSDVAATVSVGRTSFTGYPAGGEHRYRFVGSDGILVVDAHESIGVLHRSQGTGVLRSEPAANSVMAMLDDIARAICTGHRPGVGPDDARAVLAVTLAARRAAESGTVVDL